MKVKNIVAREEDVISLIDLSLLYPYGVEIIEGEKIEILDREPEEYDAFLIVLDENGSLEQIFNTKAEALNSWVVVHNQKLIKNLF